MNATDLRASILQAAIEGKLVPQLESEPEVEQIGETPEDVPFTIPLKWKWATIGDSLQYGSSEQVNGQSIPRNAWVLDLEDIEKESGRLLIKKRNISNRSNKAKFKKGDVLYGKLRPYLNKCIIANKAGFSTTEIVAIRPKEGNYKFDAEYLKAFLMSPFFVNYATRASYGVKMPRLGTKDAKAAYIPVPPLAEQHRIVARLNELLPLVDDFGEAQEAFTIAQTEFPGKLEASLLQAAIEGKLVPQLESEPEVEQIGEAPEEVPFEIPKKWKWCIASDVCDLNSGRDLPKSEILESKERNCIPYLTGASQIVNGLLIINRWARHPQVLSKEGDILFTCKGTVGKIAINTAEKLHIARQIMALRPKKEVPVVSDFLKLLLLTSVPLLLARARSMIPGISRQDILTLKWPIPPETEQRRIVAQLNKLLSLIDELP